MSFLGDGIAIKNEKSKVWVISHFEKKMSWQWRGFYNGLVKASPLWCGVGLASERPSSKCLLNYLLVIDCKKDGYTFFSQKSYDF